MVSSSGQSGMTKDIELLLLLSLEAKLPPGRGKEVFIQPYIRLEFPIMT